MADQFDDLRAAGAANNAGFAQDAGAAGDGLLAMLQGARKKLKGRKPMGQEPQAVDQMLSGDPESAPQDAAQDAAVGGEGGELHMPSTDGLQGLLQRAHDATHHAPKPQTEPGPAGDFVSGSPFASEAKFRAWYGPVSRKMGLHPDPDRTGVDMRRVHKLSVMSGKNPADVMMAMDTQGQLREPQEQAISQYFAANPAGR